jgi:hypothetical protein
MKKRFLFKDKVSFMEAVPLQLLGNVLTFLRSYVKTIKGGKKGPITLRIPYNLNVNKWGSYLKIKPFL